VASRYIWRPPRGTQQPTRRIGFVGVPFSARSGNSSSGATVAEESGSRMVATNDEICRDTTHLAPTATPIASTGWAPWTGHDRPNLGLGESPTPRRSSQVPYPNFYRTSAGR
jgi:hypothetical protein